MQELIKAVIKAMSEIDNVEKNLNVGTGGSSYKGVADKDVRSAMRKILINNGLVMIPIEVEPKVTVSEWDQEEEWNGKKSTKHKTQVLTEVVTKYNLMHTSGESMIVAGYGHGVDSQDKSAGKATTYALKYALLNTFLVPTGDIDDTDNTHSDNLPQPPRTAQKKVLEKPVSNYGTTDKDEINGFEDEPSGLSAKCATCGATMIEKHGNTNGKQWNGLFCPNAKKGQPGHKPVWL